MQSISFTSAVLVCLALGGLGALTVVDIVDGPGTARQERVARTPDLPARSADLPSFLGQARFYATERYAFKDAFITLNGMVKIAMFGHSPAPNVIQGHDGFLFLNTDETIDGAQGQGRLEDDARPLWADSFSATQQAFAHHNLPFSLIIGPNKHTIYADKTPDWLNATAMDMSRTGDIFTIAQSVFQDTFVDTRATLNAARAQQPEVLLYHPTDTHWTEFGAALGVHEVLARQGLDLPVPQFEIEPLVRSGDLSRMIGQQSRWPAQAPVLPAGWSCVDGAARPIDVITIDPLMPRRFTCGTPHTRPEKIVVFTDSFGVSAIPYLAARFQSVDFIWTDMPDPEAAVSLGADYVLQILVERKLMTDDPADFAAISGSSQ